MHSNSNGNTGFLGKKSFVGKLGKSVELTIHYQLPFLQSGQFPDKISGPVIYRFSIYHFNFQAMISPKLSKILLHLRVR